MPTFAFRGRYFQERTPEAFGTRRLFVTANIIQVIPIMSRGNIGFKKSITNAVYYGYYAAFFLGARTKWMGNPKNELLS